MKLINRFLTDIKRGENIDLYITVTVALSLTLLNVLGLASQATIAPMTLAVLGLIAVNGLVNRHKIDEALNVVRTNSGTFLRDFPEGWELQLEKSKETWIVGANLSRTVVTYFSLFEQKVQRGNFINFLLITPDGNALKYSGIRRRESGYEEQNLALIQASLKSLAELKRIAPDKVSIRVIDYPLSFGCFALEPDTANGSLYISYYPFKTSGGSVPKILLTSRDHEWYEHFKQEIYNLWNNASEVL
jgi:hypothetical protein